MVTDTIYELTVDHELLKQSKYVRFDPKLLDKVDDGKSLKLVVLNHKCDLDTVASLHYHRSKNGVVNLIARVWIDNACHKGSGRCSGYGYDKLSTAAYNAFADMGLKFSYEGIEARTMLELIAKNSGYSKFLIV